MAIKFKQFYKNQQSKYTIFLDMDGVLCNFVKAFRTIAGFEPGESSADNKNSVYTVLQNVPIEFWSKMTWMSDGKELWNYVKNLNVKICSTPIDTNTCINGKKYWCKVNLGAQITVILTATKEDYASPTHILIDDREKNINKWAKASGIGILHKNTKDTLRQLEKILVKE